MLAFAAWRVTNGSKEFSAAVTGAGRRTYKAKKRRQAENRLCRQFI